MNEALATLIPALEQVALAWREFGQAMKESTAAFLTLSDALGPVASCASDPPVPTAIRGIDLEGELE